MHRPMSGQGGPPTGRQQTKLILEHRGQLRQRDRDEMARSEFYRQGDAVEPLTHSNDVADIAVTQLKVTQDCGCALHKQLDRRVVNGTLGADTGVLWRLQRRKSDELFAWGS